MKKINVFSAPTSGSECNCFIVSCEGSCVLIDAGADPKAITSVINENNLNLSAIILTHGHYDHISALPELKVQYPDAKIIISKKDSKLLGSESCDNLAQLLFDVDFPGIIPNEIINKNTKKIISNMEFHFYLTPGHTEGSMIIILEHHMFTGDTLFNLSVGRTDFPTGSREKQIQSLDFIKTNFTDDYIIHPGHEGDSNLDYEKKFNPYLNPRSPYEDTFEH